MVFFVSLIITLVFAIFELSFGHSFQVFGAVPYITLAFLVSLSVRSRNYFQIFLALIAGLLFDFASIHAFPVFTIIFVLIMILGRIVFYRKTSYKSLNSFVVLLLISVVVVYLISLPTLINNQFLGWQNYLKTFIAGIILTTVIGLIIYRLLEPYYSWLDKKTEK